MGKLRKWKEKLLVAKIVIMKRSEMDQVQGRYR